MQKNTYYFLPITSYFPKNPECNLGKREEVRGNKYFSQGFALLFLFYSGIVMADSPLIIKLKEFALQIIKVCNYVKQTKKESVLTNQLIRSGTSVGANIREAFTDTELPTLLPNFKLHLKNVLKVNIG